MSGITSRARYRLLPLWMGLLVLTCGVHASTVTAWADEPPDVQHVPIGCTVPDKPMSLCATVTDDGQVARSRIYFREAREKYFSFVDMVFGGIQYCGTLPAVRTGKVKTFEYYVQAIDDTYQTRRTSTYVMQVEPENVCGFPPVETDARRAASIVVHATDRKQGKKLSDAFVATGVSFVPAAKD